MEKHSISKIQAIILGARPKTLPAAAAPVIVGSGVAYAENTFHPITAIVALLGGLLLQIGANYANDVFDFYKGTDANGRLGPTRVTQAGLLTPTEVKITMWITFGLAALCGLYLTWVSGWVIVLIGLLSILAAIAYTGGPFPFGYRGLGEVFVFLFFGVAAVTGTYYAQAGTISWLAVLASFPMGLLTCNILVVNNLRDIESDRIAGKMTLAVRFGSAWTKQEYVALAILSYLIVFLLGISNLTSAWVMLSWLSLPMLFPLIRSVYHDTGKVLNKTLAGTGKIELYFAILFTLGLVLSAHVPI